MKLFWTTFLDALQRFTTKGGFVRASHVALSVMLAMFPFCIFVLSLAGVLSADTQVDDLVDVVFGSWPEEISEPIANELRAVLQHGGGTLTLGAVLSIVFASNGVDAIRLVITSAYRDDDPRPFWKTRTLSVGFVLAGTLLIIAAGLFSVAVPLALHFFEEWVPWLQDSILSNDQFRQLVIAAILLFAVYSCHKWLPGIRHSDRSLAPGIILTVILWTVASNIFSYYISHFSTYSVTYAGLAGIMSALVYLYLMASIFVLGAEYNGSLFDQRRAATEAVQTDVPPAP
ncbi:YihY/virulence factor BrkB family protein [Shimia aestuarii]|uniref:Membrane protein n=1 Tax=Shimia aestuarii TaxID=254406 RepID=A0A1I4T1C8_9RHOB|nr:YihY/virulence factor BrkB family protein [Shimia aestuarii]SFM70459.1 membrane protein [Shimia aestuarii]